MLNASKLPVDSDGKLSAYAWPGGYPIFYLSKRDCCCLCPKCADKDREDIGAFDIHWEGEPIRCEDCGATIESAYGIPD